MAARIIFSKKRYPFTGQRFGAAGVEQHYLDEGSGPAVVMVHGNPTWSFYFRELVLSLRPNFRCIVPDHVGCGLSSRPRDHQYEYTLQRRVEDLEALLDHLHLDRGVTFIGHDWGGMIAAACATRRPERIDRCVFMNTAAFLPPAGMPLHWTLRLLRHRNVLAETAVRGLNLFSGPAVWLATSKGLPAAVRRGLTAPYRSWSQRIAIARFVQDIPAHRKHRSYELTKWVDEHLHLLAGKPMLICWGERDFVFNREYLAEWRRRFPQAGVESYSDAGHYVLEDARDRVVRAVKRFLGVGERSQGAA